MGTVRPKADVLLHPERLAIVRALAGRQLTARQLADELPAVATATLYRHLTALVDAGILAIAAERRVRGTTERTYALGEHAILTAEALADATPDDHFRYFATFVSGLLEEYARYVGRPGIDVERDGVGYRFHELQLSDDELADLLGEIREAIARRQDNAPGAGRTPRLLATLTLPITRND